MIFDPSGKPSISFTLYAMELEGELNTPLSKQRKFLNILRDRALTGSLTRNDVLDAAETADYDIDIDEIDNILEEFNG